jgi:hypothetical protein
MTDGMTPEEESAFIADSYKEAGQMDVDALVNNDLVQKLLAQPESSECGIYKYGELEIRYKPVLTSKLRLILKKADRESKMPNADALGIQDRVVYEGLAELCMDPALKNPVVWAAIDAKTTDGRVYKIFKDLVEVVGGNNSSTKSVR